MAVNSMGHSFLCNNLYFLIFFKKSADANISMKNYPACNEIKKEKNITPSLIKNRHLNKTKNIVTYVRQFNY